MKDLSWRNVDPFRRGGPRLPQDDTSEYHSKYNHNFNFGEHVPKLDARLIAVTKQIRSSTHVDIGSDHGGLLASLLQSGRIEYGIAIENKQQPYENSARALANLAADVRFGDGLAAFKTDEAESLSICGMGAESIEKILEAFPQRVPDRVVLQPNGKPEIIRRWAWKNHFHLCDEQITWGHPPYTILSFQRATERSGNSPNDPAYENVDHQAAILFGPLTLKRDDPRITDHLRDEENYWSQFSQLEPHRVQRLAVIRNLLDSVDYQRASRR